MKGAEILMSDTMIKIILAVLAVGFITLLMVLEIIKNYPNYKWW